MKIIVASLVLLMSAVSAHADSIVYVIAKLQAEIGGINGQISAERGKANRLTAEMTRRANEINAMKARHDEMQRQFAIHVEAYNRSCAGRPVNYDGCAGWRARMIAERQQTEPVVVGLERQANGIRQQYTRLSNDLVLTQTRIQKLANYNSQIAARVQGLKSSLASQCAGLNASAGIAEMNQKCGHLQFAGAQSDIPRCTTNECSKLTLPPPPPPPAQVANTPNCEGTFCTKENPKNAGGPEVPPGQKQTTYSSASAQAVAAAKAGVKSGCVFDGQAGCTPGQSLTFPQPGSAPRGSAGLSASVKEAMNKTPQGQQLIKEEMALRSQYSGAEAKANEIKAKRDAETDSAKKGQLAVEFANADKLRSDLGQQLYTKEIAVETEAKKYVLDK